MVSQSKKTQKQNKSKKQAQKGTVTVYRNPRPIYGTGSNPENLTLKSHFNMVVDPCEADLTKTAYKGQAGILQRFCKVTTWSPLGTETGAIIGLQPGWGGQWITSCTDSAIAKTVAWGQNMPGTSFMNANADAFRAVGCCVDVDYVGTELNRSGLISAAVVPNTYLTQGATVTSGGLAAACTAYGRIRDSSMTVKWLPGNSDDEYISNGISGNGVDSANTLLIVLQGLPSGVQVSYRITVIYEWLPKTGVDMPAPNVIANRNVVGGFEKLHNYLNKVPEIWQNLTHAYKDGKKMLGYVSQAAEGGARAMRMLEYGTLI